MRLASEVAGLRRLLRCSTYRESGLRTGYCFFGGYRVSCLQYRGRDSEYRGFERFFRDQLDHPSFIIDRFEWERKC